MTVDISKPPRERVFYTTKNICGHASIVDIVLPNGLGRFGSKTLAQTREEYPDAVILDAAEAYRRYDDSFRRPPTEITKDKYWYALEVLPPVAWEGCDTSTETFKISELLAGNITHIYCRIGERYFELCDNIRTPHREIVRRCLEFMKGGT